MQCFPNYKILKFAALLAKFQRLNVAECGKCLKTPVLSLQSLPDGIVCFWIAKKKKGNTEEIKTITIYSSIHSILAATVLHLLPEDKE